MSRTVQELVQNSAERLGQLIRPIDQRWFEAELLVGHVLHQDRSWVALHPEQGVTLTHVQQITKLVERRLTYEPMAYILGQAPFLASVFTVNRHVLVPRPESEWLVQTTIAHIGDAKNWTVWDVGTGSGCLGLSVAQTLTHIHVIASDYSKKALQVAQLNAERRHLKNISLLHGSLLAKPVKEALTQTSKHHFLIIANLPYLPLSDRGKLQKQVTEYEPTQALFAKEDGLYLIQRLLQQLKRFLKERTGDVVLLEHDPRQAHILLNLCNTLFPNATVRQDKDYHDSQRFTAIYT